MNIQFFTDTSAAAIIRADLEQSRVEMWTTRRLPFEPKGALLQSRDRLRVELRKLNAKPHTFLDARYVSITTGFVDTENVLLYNVGPSAFGAASRFGLKFARDFSEPPKAPSSGTNWRHYHVYSLVPAQSFELGTSPKGSFNFPLRQLDLSLKPHDFWWGARNGLARVENALAPVSGPYAMSIEMKGPCYPSNVAAIVKPLFDGVISALHFDPMIHPDDSVCGLLAAKLRTSPASVANSLRSSSNAIFGTRKVVSIYRQFVKWNPADELCLIGQLSVGIR